jgi:hypothetical protein
MHLGGRVSGGFQVPCPIGMSALLLFRVRVRVRMRVRVRKMGLEKDED